ARDAYFDARAKWDRAAREQARMIKEFHQVVMTARGNYQTAEKANSELWA
ncbi:MAG: WXG100 family type VII secretion target, partial [Actinomadura rubrobrunea]|nr:WXG100 family type VII secretion target [Actinomadura rubrobrunea]